MAKVNVGNRVNVDVGTPVTIGSNIRVGNMSTLDYVVARRAQLREQRLKEEEAARQRQEDADAEAEEAAEAIKEEVSKPKAEDKKEPEAKPDSERSTNVVKDDNSNLITRDANGFLKVKSVKTLDELNTNASAVVKSLYNDYLLGKISAQQFAWSAKDLIREQEKKSLLSDYNAKLFGIDDGKKKSNPYRDALKSVISDINDNNSRLASSPGASLENANLVAQNDALISAITPLTRSNSIGGTPVTADRRQEAKAAVDDLNATADSIANKIGDISDAYGFEGQDFQEYSNALLQRDNEGKTVVDRIAEAEQTIGQLRNGTYVGENGARLTNAEARIAADDMQRNVDSMKQNLISSLPKFGSYENIVKFTREASSIADAKNTAKKKADAYGAEYADVFADDAETQYRSDVENPYAKNLLAYASTMSATDPGLAIEASMQQARVATQEKKQINPYITQLFGKHKSAALSKYFDIRVTRATLEREKNRVLNEKAANDERRWEQYKKVYGDDGILPESTRKFIASHYDFEADDQDKAVAQSELDATYTIGESLDRQLEYLDKALILTDDSGRLAKTFAGLENYGFDHWTTRLGEILLVGAPRYWDEGIGDILRKQKRGELLTENEKLALKSVYDKQRMEYFTPVLKEQGDVDMDSWSNPYTQGAAGIEMAGFALPIMAENWLARGATKVFQLLGRYGSAMVSNFGKAGKAAGYTLEGVSTVGEYGSRLMSGDMYDKLSRITYKALTRSGKIKNDALRRAIAVTSGGIGKASSVVAGGYVEMNTIGRGMWKQNFNNWEAGMMSAKTLDDGTVEYSNTYFTDADGNTIDTVEEAERAADLETFGEYASERTGFMFDGLLGAASRKIGLSRLVPGILGDISRKLTRLSGGTVSSIPGEFFEEVANNIFQAAVGLNDWKSVVDGSQNLNTFMHLAIAMLQQQAFTGVIGGMYNVGATKVKTARQLSQSRDILREQYMKAHEGVETAAKDFEALLPKLNDMLKSSIQNNSMLSSDERIADINGSNNLFGTKEMLAMFGLDKSQEEYTNRDRVLLGAISQYAGIYALGHMTKSAIANNVINNLSNIKGRSYNQIISSMGGWLTKKDDDANHTLMIRDENGVEINTGMQFNVDENGDATPVNSDDMKHGINFNMASAFLNRGEKGSMSVDRNLSDESKKKLELLRSFFVLQRNALVKNAFIYQTLAETGRLDGVLGKVYDDVKSNTVGKLRAKISNFFGGSYEKINKFDDQTWVDTSAADRDLLRKMPSEIEYARRFASSSAMSMNSDRFNRIFKLLGAESDFEKKAVVANIFANDRLKQANESNMFVARTSMFDALSNDKATADRLDSIVNSIIDDISRAKSSGTISEDDKAKLFGLGLKLESEYNAKKLRRILLSTMVDRLIAQQLKRNHASISGFTDGIEDVLNSKMIKLSDILESEGFDGMSLISSDIDKMLDSSINNSVRKQFNDVSLKDHAANFINSYINNLIISGKVSKDKEINKILDNIYKAGFITDADISGFAFGNFSVLSELERRNGSNVATLLDDLKRDLNFNLAEHPDVDFTELYTELIKNMLGENLGLNRDSVIKALNEVDLSKLGKDTAMLVKLIREELKLDNNRAIAPIDAYIKNTGDLIDQIKAEHNKRRLDVLNKMVRQATRFSNTLQFEPFDDVKQNEEEIVGSAEDGENEAKETEEKPAVEVTEEAPTEITEEQPVEEAPDEEQPVDEETEEPVKNPGEEPAEETGDGETEEPNEDKDAIQFTTELNEIASSINSDAIENPDFVDGIIDQMFKLIASMPENANNAFSNIRTKLEEAGADITAFNGAAFARSQKDGIDIPMLTSEFAAQVDLSEKFSEADAKKSHLSTFLYYTAETKDKFFSYFGKEGVHPNDGRIKYHLRYGSSDANIDDVTGTLADIRIALSELESATKDDIDSVIGRLLSLSTRISIDIEILDNGNFVKCGSLFGSEVIESVRKTGEEYGAESPVVRFMEDRDEIINLARSRESLFSSILQLDQANPGTDVLKVISPASLNAYFPREDVEKTPSTDEDSPLNPKNNADLTTSNVYMVSSTSEGITTIKSINQNNTTTVESDSLGQSEFVYVRGNSNTIGSGDIVAFQGSNIGKLNNVATTESAYDFVRFIFKNIYDSDGKVRPESHKKEFFEYLNRFILTENLHAVSNGINIGALRSLRDAAVSANKDYVTINDTKVSVDKINEALSNFEYNTSIYISATKDGMSISLKYIDKNGELQTVTRNFTANDFVSDNAILSTAESDDNNKYIDILDTIYKHFAINLNKANFDSDISVDKIAKFTGDESIKDVTNGEVDEFNFIPGAVTLSANIKDGKINVASAMQNSGAFICGSTIDKSGNIKTQDNPRVYLTGAKLNVDLGNVVTSKRRNRDEKAKSTPVGSSSQSLKYNSEQEQVIASIKETEANSTLDHDDKSRVHVTGLVAGKAESTNNAASGFSGADDAVGTICDALYREAFAGLKKDGSIKVDGLFEINADGTVVLDSDGFDIKKLFGKEDRTITGQYSIAPETLEKFADKPRREQIKGFVKFLVSNYIVYSKSGSADPQNPIKLDDRTTESAATQESVNTAIEYAASYVVYMARQIFSDVKSLNIEPDDIVRTVESRSVNGVLMVNGEENFYDGPKVALELPSSSDGRFPEMRVQGELDMEIVKKDGHVIIVDFKKYNPSNRGPLENACAPKGKYNNQLNVYRLGRERTNGATVDGMYVMGIPVAPLGNNLFTFVQSDENLFKIDKVDPEVKLENGDKFIITDDGVVPADGTPGQNSNQASTVGEVRDPLRGAHGRLRYKVDDGLPYDPIDKSIIKVDAFGRKYIEMNDVMNAIRSADTLSYAILKTIVNKAIANGVDVVYVTDIANSFGETRTVVLDGKPSSRISIDRTTLDNKKRFAATLLHEMIHASLSGFVVKPRDNKMKSLYDDFLEYSASSNSSKATALRMIVTDFEEFMAEIGNDASIYDFVRWRRNNNLKKKGIPEVIINVYNKLLDIIDKISSFLGLGNVSAKRTKRIVFNEIMSYISNRDNNSGIEGASDGIKIRSRANTSNEWYAIVLDNGKANSVKRVMAKGNIDSLDDQDQRAVVFFASLLSSYRTKSGISDLANNVRSLNTKINGNSLNKSDARAIIKLFDTYLTINYPTEDERSSKINERLSRIISSISDGNNGKVDEKTLLNTIIIASRSTGGEDKLRDAFNDFVAAMESISKVTSGSYNDVDARINGLINDINSGWIDGIISINKGISIVSKIYDANGDSNMQPSSIHDLVTSAIGGDYSALRHIKTRSEAVAAIKSICAPIVKILFYNNEATKIRLDFISRLINEKLDTILYDITASGEKYDANLIRILENLSDLKRLIDSGDSFIIDVVKDAVDEMSKALEVSNDKRVANSLDDIIQYKEEDIPALQSMSDRLKIILSTTPAIEVVNNEYRFKRNKDTDFIEASDLELVYGCLVNRVGGFSRMSEFVSKIIKGIKSTNSNDERCILIGILMMIGNSTVYDSLDRSIQDAINDKLNEDKIAGLYKSYVAISSSARLNDQHIALLLNFMNREKLVSINTTISNKRNNGVVVESNHKQSTTEASAIMKSINNNVLHSILTKLNIDSYDPTNADDYEKIVNEVDAIHGMVPKNRDISISNLIEVIDTLGLSFLNTDGVSANDVRSLINLTLESLKNSLMFDRIVAANGLYTESDGPAVTALTPMYSNNITRYDEVPTTVNIKNIRNEYNKVSTKARNAVKSIANSRLMYFEAVTLNANGDRIQLDKPSNFVESKLKKAKKDADYRGCQFTNNNGERVTANSIVGFGDQMIVAHVGTVSDTRAGSTTNGNDYNKRNAIDLICSRFRELLDGAIPLPTMSSNGFGEVICSKHITSVADGRKSWINGLFNVSNSDITLTNAAYNELANRALVEITQAESAVADINELLKSGNEDDINEKIDRLQKVYHHNGVTVKDGKVTDINFGNGVKLPRFGTTSTLVKSERIVNGKTQIFYPDVLIDFNAVISDIISAENVEPSNKIQALLAVYKIARAVYDGSICNKGVQEEVKDAMNRIGKIANTSNLEYAIGIISQTTLEPMELKRYIFKGMLRNLRANSKDMLKRYGLINEDGDVMEILPGVRWFDPNDTQTAEETYTHINQNNLDDYLSLIEALNLIGTVDFENFFSTPLSLFKDPVDQTKRYQSLMSTGTEPVVIEFDHTTGNDNVSSDTAKDLSSLDFTYASISDIKVGEREDGDNNLISVGNEKFGMRSMFREYAENLYDKAKFDGDTQEERDRLKNKAIDDFVKLRMDAICGNRSIASADGACFITMKGLRKYLKKEGRWTGEQIDKFFEAVEKGNEFSDPEIKEMYVNIVLSPMKLVYVGDRYEYESGQPGNQDESAVIYKNPSSTKTKVLKMAVFPLLPSMCKEGSVGRRIAEMADKAGIEIIGDSEIEKAGGTRPADVFEVDKNDKNIITEKTDGTGLRLQRIRAQFLRRQLETNPHEDDERKLGTQMMLMILADLAGVEIKTSDGTIKPGSEVRNGVLKKIGDLADTEMKRMLDRWIIYDNGVPHISTNTLKEILRSTAIEHQLGQDIMQQIRRIGSDNAVPLSALVNSALFQSKLMAIARDSVQSITSNGGAFIQVPQTLFRKIGESTDRLKLVNKHNAMECIVSVNAFRSILESVDWDAWRESKGRDKSGRPYSINEAREFLRENNLIGENAKANAVGYRIPTQSKASTLAISVKDIVGSECGDIIVLPDGYIAITGSDFDIDKLYFAIKSYNVTKDKDGNQIVVDVDSRVRNIEGRMAELRRNLGIEQYSDNSDEIKKEINELNRELLSLRSKQIASSILDDYIDILTSSSQFVDTHTTIDSGSMIFKQQTSGLIDRLKVSYSGVRRSVTSSRDDDGNDVKKDILLYHNSIAYQVNKKLENAGAKYGIGPFAKASVNHVLAQVAELRLSSSAPNGTDSAKMIVGGVDSLHDEVARDGVKISDWLSYFINAHVDAAKDPYILDFNVNKATWSAACLMLRAGFGQQTLFVLSQESIRVMSAAKEFAEACSVTDGRKNKYAKEADYISSYIDAAFNELEAADKENIHSDKDCNWIYSHLKERSVTDLNGVKHTQQGMFTGSKSKRRINSKFNVSSTPDHGDTDPFYRIFFGNDGGRYIEIMRKDKDGNIVRDKNKKPVSDVVFMNNQMSLLEAMAKLRSSKVDSVEYEVVDNGNTIKKTLTRSQYIVYQLGLMCAFQKLNAVGKALDTVVNTCQVEQGKTGTNFHEFNRYKDGIADAVTSSSRYIDNVTDIYTKTHLFDKILTIDNIVTSLMNGTSVSTTGQSSNVIREIIERTGNKYGNRKVANRVSSFIENELLLEAIGLDNDTVLKSMSNNRLKDTMSKIVTGSDISSLKILDNDERKALSLIQIGTLMADSNTLYVPTRFKTDISSTDIELIKSALDKLYKSDGYAYKDENYTYKDFVKDFVVSSLYSGGIVKSGNGVFDIISPWCFTVINDMIKGQNGSGDNISIGDKQMNIANGKTANGEKDKDFGTIANAIRMIAKYGYTRDMLFRYVNASIDKDSPFELPELRLGRIGRMADEAKTPVIGLTTTGLPIMFSSSNKSLSNRSIVRMNKGTRSKIYMKVMTISGGKDYAPFVKVTSDFNVNTGSTTYSASVKDGSAVDTYVFVEIPKYYYDGGGRVVNSADKLANGDHLKQIDAFEKLITASEDKVGDAVFEYINFLYGKYIELAKNANDDGDYVSPKTRSLNTILKNMVEEFNSGESSIILPLAIDKVNYDISNVFKIRRLNERTETFAKDPDYVYAYNGDGNIAPGVGTMLLVREFFSQYLNAITSDFIYTSDYNVFASKLNYINDMIPHIPYSNGSDMFNIDINKTITSIKNKIDGMVENDQINSDKKSILKSSLDEIADAINNRKVANTKETVSVRPIDSEYTGEFDSSDFDYQSYKEFIADEENPDETEVNKNAVQEQINNCKR